MRYLIFFLLSFFIFSCTQSPERVNLKKELHSDWTFNDSEQSESFPAKIPGNIHLDLFNNKLIPDPFVSNNEEKLKWIEEKDWTYTTLFDLSNEELSKEEIYLVFEGLDTYADIFLNNELLFSSDNMFKKYSIDVKAYLKQKNDLLIKFKSTIKKAEPLYDNHLVQLPAGNDRNDKATSVFTRKAPYQFGWDWGPRLVGCGIWKPVYLEFWHKINIKSSRVYQSELTEEQAIIGVDLQIQSEFEETIHIQVLKDGKFFQEEKLSLKKGENDFKKEYIITNPQRWWPNGSGDPHLYHFTVKVNHSKFYWEKDFKIGFKTIELERTKDSIGESFQFLVNGIPIYMKGANYIPNDAFPSRVGYEDYEKIIHLTKEANMNMLRLWGGGIYEMDPFYELCDENGILVWQDFMFACSLYPGDSNFLRNVEEEAIYQIERIRDHASLALWCGNNEINELWHNWGYQKAFNYSEQDSIDTWNNYLKLFDKLLHKLVEEYDPKTSYLESSPVFGWGREESMTHGDSHYWGIWWGKQPFEMYQEKIPRFSSEFGFQSLPHMNTILSFTDSTQLDLFSEDMKAHQKSSIGNQTILDYLPLYYPEPNNFTEMIYISQLLQAYGMDLAFRAQRLAKPRCMGTLYWQLNDCWPGLSWSSIDYYQQKKATHYAAEQDFATFMIQTELKNKQIVSSIVSDSLETIDAKLEVSILSFNGDTLMTYSKDINIPANEVVDFNLSPLLASNINTHEIFIYSKLSHKNKLLAQQVDFLEKPKNLDLTKSILKIKEIAKNQFELNSSPSDFHYSVSLSTSEFGNFEPNFFHLLPGETVIIEFIPNKKDRQVRSEDIKLMSLNEL